MRSDAEVSHMDWHCHIRYWILSDPSGQKKSFLRKYWGATVSPDFCTRKIQMCFAPPEFSTNPFTNLSADSLWLFDARTFVTMVAARHTLQIIRVDYTFWFHVCGFKHVWAVLIWILSVLGCNNFPFYSYTVQWGSMVTQAVRFKMHHSWMQLDDAYIHVNKYYLCVY